MYTVAQCVSSSSYVKDRNYVINATTPAPLTLNIAM